MAKATTNPPVDPVIEFLKGKAYGAHYRLAPGFSSYTLSHNNYEYTAELSEGVLKVHKAPNTFAANTAAHRLTQARSLLAERKRQVETKEAYMQTVYQTIEDNKNDLKTCPVQKKNEIQQTIDLWEKYVPEGEAALGIYNDMLKSAQADVNDAEKAMKAVEVGAEKFEFTLE